MHFFPFQRHFGYNVMIIMRIFAPKTNKYLTAFMNRNTITAIFLAMGLSCSAQVSPKLRTGYANPLIDHLFTADPTAVEYQGRLYVYGTNDTEQYEKADSCTYEKIKTLAMISTDDMVNWTYHGCIPVGEIAPWIINSWAPSVVSRVEDDGKTHFYLYFSNSGYGTGVLTATSPVGPWTSPLTKSLVDATTPGLGDCKVPFDPGAVIDANGTGWLAFGAGKSRIARLGKDMISFDSPFINPHPAHHFEANEMDYIGGKYVYTYNIDWQDHDDWTQTTDVPTRCCMYYMTSDTPLDSASWHYENNYLNNPGQFGIFSYSNNHTHLHKYMGKWYVLYHTLMLEDEMGIKGGFRSMQVDEIRIDESVPHIYPATMTKKGVTQIHPFNPYLLQQAETAAATEGIRFESSGEVGNMIATAGSSFIKHSMPEQSIILVRQADFGKRSKQFVATVRGKGTIEVLTDSLESPVKARLTSESSSWKQVKTSCKLSGTHDLIFILKGDIQFDSWQFK